MALTGLFLCLFLTGHLLGNLQLIFSDGLHFNQYALFMTTNPAVKILSYLTYFSILFHAFDGILLAVKNRQARPIGYVKNSPEKNTIWASRNMAVLGSLILIFIVVHMVNFWAVMHFDKDMPVQTITAPNTSEAYYLTTSGNPIPVSAKEQGLIEFKNRTEIYRTDNHLKIADAYKDLYKITVDFFQDAKWGLIATILYVFSMLVLAFHLYHGFGSAFQSMGINNPRYNMFIKNFGKAFAIIVPLLFAVIPVYIHFFLKAH